MWLNDQLGCLVGMHRASSWTAELTQGIWLSSCRCCKRRMSYCRGAWRLREAPDPRRPGRSRHRLIALTASVTLVGAAATAGEPLVEEPAPPRISLAGIEIERERQLGLPCRSPLDGSIPSAVAQVQSSIPQGARLIHHDTYLGPEQNGSYDLNMAFWIERPGAPRRLEEAYRTVDAKTCEARLLEVTSAT